MPLPRVVLDYDSGVPVYRQIGDAVLGAIAQGMIGPEEKLPTIHQLASELGVNPNTVARAYRELEQAGHVVGERGRGTFPAAAPRRQTSAQELRKIATRALADCARQGFTA